MATHAQAKPIPGSAEAEVIDGLQIGVGRPVLAIDEWRPGPLTMGQYGSVGIGSVVTISAPDNLDIPAEINRKLGCIMFSMRLQTAGEPGRRRSGLTSIMAQDLCRCNMPRYLPGG
jgi:hypothetical protein